MARSCQRLTRNVIIFFLRHDFHLFTLCLSLLSALVTLRDGRHGIRRRSPRIVMKAYSCRRKCVAYSNHCLLSFSFDVAKIKKEGISPKKKYCFLMKYPRRVTKWNRNGINQPSSLSIGLFPLSCFFVFSCSYSSSLFLSCSLSFSEVFCTLFSSAVKDSFSFDRSSYATLEFES